VSAISGLVKIPELRKRILFSLGMLAIYRLGVHIPTPGVDGAALAQFFSNIKGTIFGWFSVFSGGALERFSIFALGVMPYISSSIIFQMLTVAWPYLHELQKEGEQGRKKITQYTRYGAIFLAIIQGYFIATALESQNSPSPVVLNPGLTFRFMTTVTLTAGTAFLMWLGEQISERGLGNGTSLIIFAGIASRIPQGITSAFALVKNKELSSGKLGLVAAMIAVAFFCIIFIEKAIRKIPVQYAKRIVGRKIYGGQNTHLPLKINSSGVMPPIFAGSVMAIPATIAAFISMDKMQQMSQFLTPGSLMYNVVYVLLILFFSFFVTSVLFKTDDLTENLKKYGGFIPNIRPGEDTARYIDYVLTRLTVVGAVYIAVICVLPNILTTALKVPFYFAGTSVLILVGVGLDTISQVETFLLTRNYEGFSKRGQGMTSGRPVTSGSGWGGLRGSRSKRS
jgi:preprotein translocase subunit SecY